MSSSLKPLFWSRKKREVEMESEFKIDPATHIGMVSLRVSNLQRSLVFYGEVLGFVPELDADDKGATLSVHGVPLVHLEEVPGSQPRPRRSTGLYHLAVLLPDRAALGRSFKRLITSGYPMTGAADHLVSEALYLDDPDKNGIELYRDRPKDEWQFDGPSVRMANEPVDLDSLFRDAGEEAFPGLPSGTTMGHVHLHVRDLDEAEEFYSKILGFDVMLRWPPSALFTSAGGYHHHIGLNTWAGVGAPPPPTGSAGLDHFQIVLPNAAALQSAVERLKQLPSEIEERQEGVFIRDPSGNGIVLTVG